MSFSEDSTPEELELDEEEEEEEDEDVEDEDVEDEEDEDVDDEEDDDEEDEEDEEDDDPEDDPYDGLTEGEYWRREAQRQKDRFHALKDVKPEQSKEEREEAEQKALNDAMLEDPQYRQFLTRLKEREAAGDITQQDIAIEWGLKRNDFKARLDFEKKTQKLQNDISGGKTKTVFTSELQKLTPVQRKQAKKLLISDWGIDTNSPETMATFGEAQAKKISRYVTSYVRKGAPVDKGNKKVVKKKKVKIIDNKLDLKNAPKRRKAKAKPLTAREVTLQNKKKLGLL